MDHVPTPAPTDSIWGSVEHREELLPGIWQVSTASHGGLIISSSRQLAMPDALRCEIASYEEDVDWARVYLTFEAEFRSNAQPRIVIVLQLAHDTVRAWLPSSYAAFTGRPIELCHSHVQRSIAAHKAAIGEYVVTSAFGSWADWVPPGKVGVYACKLTGVTALGFGIFDRSDEVRALTEADCYQSRTGVVTLASLAATPC